jgi:hypothetical protein
MPNLAMQSTSSKPRFSHSSGEWLCLVDTPPKTTESHDGNCDISCLLVFKDGAKQFEGFYCSDGDFGWVICTDGSKACYDIEPVEYRHKQSKEDLCSL